MRRLVGIAGAAAVSFAVLVSLLAGSPTNGSIANAAAELPGDTTLSMQVLPDAIAPLLNEEPVTTSTVVASPAARQASFPGMAHVWQSWNNCGPASVTMILSTLGIRVSQETARLPLRGTNIARGMGTASVDPWLMQEFGVHAFTRNNGTLPLLKTLITNGFAPMVTQWLEDPPSRIAHWRAVRGYDDDQGVFYAADPMRGSAVPLTYKWFEDNWRPFQFRYLVVYRPESEALLRAIVGDEWYDMPSRYKYLARAKEEALGVGSSESWLSYGEAAYQAGRLEEAASAFEKGMSLGSAIGVFNVRSSYPTLLRLLGREGEARTVTAKLSPQGTTTTNGPDQAELRAVANAGGFPNLLFRIDPTSGTYVPQAAGRIVADPLPAF